ncbi:hypothetical protein E2320_008795 [Naja naja]|nr:hypothetical protein E2320_008795 [Naja naja]
MRGGEEDGSSRSDSGSGRRRRLLLLLLPSDSAADAGPGKSGRLPRSQAPTSSAEVEVETLSLNSCFAKRPGEVQRSPQRGAPGFVSRELSEPSPLLSCTN